MQDPCRHRCSHTHLTGAAACKPGASCSTTGASSATLALSRTAWGLPCTCHMCVPDLLRLLHHFLFARYVRSVSRNLSLLQAFSCLYREYHLQLAMQHQAHETGETLCMTIVDYIACKAVRCTALFILSSNENFSHSHVHSSMNTHAATQCALKQTLVIGKTCHNAKPRAVIIYYVHACKQL